MVQRRNAGKGKRDDGVVFRGSGPMGDGAGLERKKKGGSAQDNKTVQTTKKRPTKEWGERWAV